ncbi:MAG: hypothetical protein Q4C77_08030 [Eubacteriales bacterium]|nr:hypothetical protein [Eubacteriales bacterium]
MGYQVMIKQYKGSIPVKTECWELDGTRTEQSINMETIPCFLRCTRKKEAGSEHFMVRAMLTKTLKEPVSVALEYTQEKWSGKEYVFLPAAVYDGNRMTSIRIPYPPYHAEKTEAGWEPFITDIPHLDKDGKESRIQFCSGDMSTPAMGYYSGEKKEGLLILAKHMVHGRYTGFTVSQKQGQMGFSVSCPAVREKTKYFFGKLPDGSGFFPVCDAVSDDEGIRLQVGEEIELEVSFYRIPAQDLTGYFAAFHDLRESLETGDAYASIPFSKAYTAIKEKYIERNFSEEGYFCVGTESDAPPACWQAGWVGGGINSYPFLMEDDGRAYEQALSTIRFIIEKLQYENGWYVPMYAKGIKYGDDSMEPDSRILLVRKDADLLYFLLKQAMYLREHGRHWKKLEEGIALAADAMVRFYKKNGQLGQFIHMKEERIVQGDTASAAIAPAALALAYEYLGRQEYLDAAEALGELYWDQYLKRGIMNGGPGEICQAPDSESAFAFLETCVQLYETTGKAQWLKAAKEAFELAVTWVISYDFSFPEGSTAKKLGIHTMGTVFANAQNKHSAPGICTLSGNSMLKLYRFTGDKKYLRWLGRISHAVSQFVSLTERPIKSLEGPDLPSGYINERVQTSDWEGKETVGEFLYASNWPEVTMLLTYVEVPGIYVDLDRREVFCFDHVTAELVQKDSGEMMLKVTNDTIYDAVVTLMADHSRSGNAIGHGYYETMQKIQISSGKEITIGF